MSKSDNSWAAEFFAGKQVFISGGTSGIGNGIARAFSAAGAKVLATGATIADVTAAPAIDNVKYQELDVRQGEAIETIIASLDKLDILINCAGVNRLTDEFDPDVFEDVVAINLHGTNRLCRAARPKLANGGTIVNFASMHAFFGAPHAPAYSASKGGVAQLTKALAIAYAADNIRVNAVAPGWIETAMTTSARADETRSAAILARIPMGRWGQPEDVAKVALFLSSPLAAYITGVILPVDGGYLTV